MRCSIIFVQLVNVFIVFAHSISIMLGSDLPVSLLFCLFACFLPSVPLPFLLASSSLPTPAAPPFLFLFHSRVSFCRPYRPLSPLSPFVANPCPSTTSSSFHPSSSFLPLPISCLSAAFPFHCFLHSSLACCSFPFWLHLLPFLIYCPLLPFLPVSPVFYYCRLVSSRSLPQGDLLSFYLPRVYHLDMCVCVSLYTRVYAYILVSILPICVCNWYIWVYICMGLYVCISLLYIYIYIYVYVYVYIYICMYVYVCLVCMYVCM